MLDIIKNYKTQFTNSDIIKNYKTDFTFLFILITYIVLVSLLFHYNPKEIINKYGTLSIITALFGFFLILMIMFFIKRRGQEFGPQFNNNNQSQIQQFPPVIKFIYDFIVYILVFAIPVCVIIGLYYLLKDASAITSSTIFILNIFIVIITATLVYQCFKPLLEEQKYLKKSKKTQFLIDVIFVIPCLVTDLINFLKNEYKITTRTELIILGIQIVLIGLRIIIPKLLSKIIKHDGIELLKEPINLNCETSLGSYDILNKIDKNNKNTKNNKNIKFNYNYGFSFWIYIDPQPPSTNETYSENTNILSYGGKPSILYNGLTNEIIITAKTGKEEKEVFRLKDVAYQKWTNFIINYQAGNLDIFIDNNLVSSTPNIVPYMTYDNITVGKKNGIYGYIKDVVYFNSVLTRNKISWINNS